MLRHIFDLYHTQTLENVIWKHALLKFSYKGLRNACPLHYFNLGYHSTRISNSGSAIPRKPARWQRYPYRVSVHTSVLHTSQSGCHENNLRRFFCAMWFRLINFDVSIYYVRHDIKGCQIYSKAKLNFGYNETIQTLFKSDSML